MKKLIVFAVLAGLATSLVFGTACMTTRTNADGSVVVSQIDTDFIESALDLATSPETLATLQTILELKQQLENAATAAERVNLREDIQLAFSVLNQIAPDLAKNLESK